MTDVIDRLAVTELVANHVRLAHRERIACNVANPWQDREMHAAWLAVLRATRVRVISPGVVACTAPDTEDGRTWGHVAREILDAGAAGILDGADLRSAEVHTLTSNAYILTFTITGAE